MDSYLERLKEAIASATDGMSAGKTSFAMRKGSGASAEILEHLYLSYTGTTKGCQRCLEAGKPFAHFTTLTQRIKVS